MTKLEFVTKTPIEKGWSGDKKYCAVTADGTKYLLRITPENKSARCADIFRMQQTVSLLGVPMCRPIEMGKCDEGAYTVQTWVDGDDAEDVIKELSEDEQYIYGLEAGYRDEEVGLRREHLTEGCWSFEVQFPESCERELELISEPVTIQCVLGGGPLIPGVNHTDPVEVTSFRIRALTAEICFKYAYREQINGNFGEICAVMKNGTQILLNARLGYPNFLSFTFDAPLDLDQVDHILFPDKTVLPIR